MQKGIVVFIVLAVTLGLVFTHLAVLHDLRDIRSTSSTMEYDSDPPSSGPAVPEVRIGVVSRYAPHLIYAGYQPILDFLNARSDYHYSLRLSTSYEDAVQHLVNGEVQASFLGAWMYAELGLQSGLSPILSPMNQAGESVFHAALVTGPGSTIQSIGDLEGKSIALPSPLSWSANWLQRCGLASVGLTESSVGAMQFFAHHQTVVWEVLDGTFDAGVVKISVAEQFASEGLHIVAKSPPIPGAPLVCRSGDFSPALQQMCTLLADLDFHLPADAAILAGWHPEYKFGFTRVDSSAYFDAFCQGGKP